MKIIYISHLKGDVASGLSWSVPASVLSQSKYDDVYWLNTSNAVMKHWADVKCFHAKENIRLNFFSNFPKFYRNPDLVVFEGFYDSLYDPLWGRQLSHQHIPYIIIPRSALSIKAMNNHAKFKKRIAHLMLYNKFIMKSAALHLLTNREAEETTCIFNKQYCVIPNGINIPSNISDKSVIKGIKAVYIGRIDVHQKGLDLLIEAITIKANELRGVDFSLNIYGPKSQDYDYIKNLIKEKSIGDIVILKDEIFDDKKVSVLNEANLFVLTSRFEGHPMGLIEALSYGVPCLITEGTNMTHEVKKSNAGFVSNISLEGVLSMIDELLARKQELPMMSKQAELLSREYNWDGIAKLTHEYYSKVVNNENYNTTQNLDNCIGFGK